MEQPTQIEGYAYGVYAGLKAPNNSLAAHAQQSVARLDIAECYRIIAWTNDHPSSESTLALGALTAKPKRYKAKRAWNHQQWVEMRVSAIEALRRTKSTLASVALANSLMYESGNVRALAKDAIEEVGAEAVPMVLENVQSCQDWPLHGMLESIDVLGCLDHPKACPVLIRVLLGQLPEASDRMFKSMVGWSLRIGLSIGAVIAMAGLCSTPISFDSYMLLIIPVAFGVAMFTSVAAALPVGLVISRIKAQEAVKLKTAAADALIRIKDPRSVISVLHAATGGGPFWTRHESRRVLTAVLPSLKNGHSGMFNDVGEQKLSWLLGAKNSDLLLAVVRSLEFVGSGQSVDAIERFIRHRSPNYESDAMGTAISEAERLLPILQERRRQEQAPATLLRASQPDEASGDGLLRPANECANNEVPADVLLRSSGQTPS